MCRRRANETQEHGRRRTIGAALTSVALMCGCATVHDRRYPVAEGWQAVTIIKFAGEFIPPLRPADDCRRNVQLATQQDVRFAETVFWSHGFLRHRIVALPEDAAVKAGDRLYVNVLDCSVRASSPQVVNQPAESASHAAPLPLPR